MMTPKENALELYEKHLRYTVIECEYEYTKKACLITVNELIEEATDYTRSYWDEVKEEINNL